MTLLLLAATLALPLFALAAVVRGVLETLEYTTTNPATGSPTWVTIPVAQVMENNAQLPREEAALANTINGQEASAAKTLTFAFPVALKDDDTFLDGLIAAESDLAPVWLRVKPKGRLARIIGGDVGCLVRVDRSPMPQFGQLDMAIVAGSATGAEPGDTYAVEAGS